MFNSSSPPSDDSNDKFMFGPFVIPREHVFYTTPFSAAFVNLRPIVPGHVLVMPQRVAPLLRDLTDAEHADLWNCVRKVQETLRKQYPSCPAFNVAVQDGVAAGQSVPHVHVHLLPRMAGDFRRSDDVYHEIQNWAPRDEMRVPLSELQVPDDGDRRDRTPQEMADEAAVYRRLMIDPVEP